ncbi:MAG: hypothetical protein AAB415_00955 [Patescibacteria group bacterium]
MRRRLIITVTLLFSVAYAPWWGSGLLVLIALGRFGSGYELLFPAVVADLAYGTPLTQFLGLAYPATFLTAGAMVGFRFLANRFFIQS